MSRFSPWSLAGVFVVAQVISLTAISAQDSPSSTKGSTVVAANANQPPSDDPFQWLEDVGGEKQLDWVRERNKVSHAKLETDSSFAKLESDLLAIMDSDARIPMVSKHGDFYYNFWRDKKNPRGLWRRTTLDEYKKEDPKWDVLLDLDALNAKEKENFVWGGAQLLRPDYRHVLISLSRGGADARIVREFDIEKRAFLEDGFTLPEAKGGVAWIDHDHVFVHTNFGEGTMTDSGYPRVTKLWKRGQPLESAVVVYEGTATDMSIASFHDDSPGFERNFVSRNIAFYNNEMFLREESGTLKKIDAPNSANKSVFHQYLALELREAWEVGGQTYPAGSLLIANFDKYMAGERKMDAVFTPTDKTALDSFGFTKNYLYINVMEDVKNRIYIMKLGDASWSKSPLAGAPNFGTVGISAVDSDESDDFFMTATDYLTPTTLSMGTIGKAPAKLKSLPAFFDANGLAITQHFATSEDGTRIPYFMVARKDLKPDGNNPTLLYGYGGFEISMQPSYSASAGRAWLTQGGVYVVANIRGGGEYGPRWHQAALKANRLRAYEDFAAVAKDLFSRKISSPRRLGIQGGSNGGLLVGNMVTLYPEIMKAAVCQVPLLDMKRYNHLLAGALRGWPSTGTRTSRKNGRSSRSSRRIITSRKRPSILPSSSRRRLAMTESTLGMLAR